MEEEESRSGSGAVSWRETWKRGAPPHRREGESERDAMQTCAIRPLSVVVGWFLWGALAPLARGEGAVAAIVFFRAERPVAGVAERGRRAVIETLQANLAATEALVERDLPELLSSSSSCVVRERLWVANALAVTAPRAVLDRAAAHPAVTRVARDGPVAPPRDFPGTVVRDSGEGPWTWGLRCLGVDEIRKKYGLTGKGVLLGHIDTGVDGGHPDLQGKVAAFRDMTGGFQTATDLDGHGTHTAGTMVGGNASGTAIGVAPGARLVVARALAGFYQLTNLLTSLQWMVDPDGDPATDDGPVAVNCSWHTDEGDQTAFYEAIAALDAAGVLVVFAAGNDGEAGLSRPHEHKATLTVAALTNPTAVAGFSAKGPAYYMGARQDKPEVAAAGSGVYSASIEGNYESLMGTSMAAPHVTGLVALIKEACPALTAGEIRRILIETARDLGPAGWDRSFGYGRAEGLRAVERAVGWPGRRPVIATFRRERLPAESDRRNVVTALTTALASGCTAVSRCLGRSVDERSGCWLSTSVTLSATYDEARTLSRLPQVDAVRPAGQARVAVDVPVDAGTWAPLLLGLPDVRATYGLEGEGVRVAVVDTGADGRHEALRGRIVDWFDASGASAVPVDTYGHGTHVAAIVAGVTEGVGVAPRAELLVARALALGGDDGYTPLLRALQWAAERQADVVNCSWSTDGDEPDQLPFYRAFEALAVLGVTVVFAAGNGGTVGIAHPAEHPSLFVVGATNRNDWAAPYSGRGPATYQGKPVQKPDVSAPGSTIRSARAGGGYENRTGTSMAAPHVTGLLALLLEAAPEAPGADLRRVVTEQSVDRGAAGWDGAFGAGRIDALAAVRALVGRVGSGVAGRRARFRRATMAP